MKIHENYSLAPTNNGVAVINDQTNQRVFFITESENFERFKQSNGTYVIGCLTLKEEEFLDMLKSLESFKSKEIPQYRKELLQRRTISPENSIKHPEKLKNLE